jgi:hypothetical protein
MGNVQSISGSSFFTLPTTRTTSGVLDLAALDLDLALEVGPRGGLIVTSLGGVNTSFGGS